MDDNCGYWVGSMVGFLLKCGTAAPRRGVKPANKVGAIN